VFDPSFANALRRSMEHKNNKSANDPWCIGYFSDNEMSWGDELSLALGALRSPPEQAAKRIFIEDLKSRYGDIARLNQAWGSDHASWQALLESREAPDKTRAGNDLRRFYTRTAEQYFRTAQEIIKAVAPNQLYLGCRFAWVNGLAAAAAAKYCDVVSYNLYRRNVADFKFNGNADVPLIIGEFHFGALDRGMFHPGLVPVAGQHARAQAYKEYVSGALQHPQFVGCHWFQYLDEPTTGRVYDEENYQIGFVDVADTPYPETISAIREIGYSLYNQQL
jgi:beta-galactosidase GanA